MSVRAEVKKKTGLSKPVSGFTFNVRSKRRERDSNPWNAERSTVFETAPIDHSGISPTLNFLKTKATHRSSCFPQRRQRDSNPRYISV